MTFEKYFSYHYSHHSSASGADAQARFYNICRHCGVGQKTSRMWLKSLRRSDGQISYTTIDGKVYYPASEIGRLLERIQYED